jgi:hypothetical protein
MLDLLRGKGKKMNEKVGLAKRVVKKRGSKRRSRMKK